MRRSTFRGCDPSPSNHSFRQKPTRKQSSYWLKSCSMNLRRGLLLSSYSSTNTFQNSCCQKQSCHQVDFCPSNFSTSPKPSTTSIRTRSKNWSRGGCRSTSWKMSTAQPDKIPASHLKAHSTYSWRMCIANGRLKSLWVVRPSRVEGITAAWGSWMEWGSQRCPSHLWRR